MEVKGLDYGENKAVNDLAASAPMASSGAPGAAAPGPRRASPQQGPDGIFAPTDNPHEPMTAGVDMGPGAGAPKQHIPEDHNMLLAQLAQAFPHPDLDHLLARVARG